MDGRARLWPNGGRYLWTDAYGFVLYCSLFEETGDRAWWDKAEWLIGEVHRVLGRARGIRIGEEADRWGQYAHYLAVWLFALWRASQRSARYRDVAIALVKQVHPAFVVPGRGVWWKMQEDLSGPAPGHGFGGLDPYKVGEEGRRAVGPSNPPRQAVRTPPHTPLTLAPPLRSPRCPPHWQLFTVYRLLDPAGAQLGAETAQLRALVEAGYRSFSCDQDLGLGMMAWCAHFFPGEPWADHLAAYAAAKLEAMWVHVDGAAGAGTETGYYARAPWARGTRLAFSNYGASLGLQALGVQAGRCAALNRYFDGYRAGDEYDTKAITWVMGCTSHLPGEFLRGNWREALQAAVPATAAAAVKQLLQEATDTGVGRGQPAQHHHR